MTSDSFTDNQLDSTNCRRDQIWRFAGRFVGKTSNGWQKRSKATLVGKERGILTHLRSSEQEDITAVQTRSSYIKGNFLETEPSTVRHYIGDTPSSEEKFIYSGRIEHFFVQECAGETRELAYVNWFKPPFFEQEVNMWRVGTSLGFFKWLLYVFLQQLDSQVVVAKDGSNLWILSPV